MVVDAVVVGVVIVDVEDWIGIVEVTEVDRGLKGGKQPIPACEKIYF